MNNKIEIFYTGGGITLAEANIDPNHFAVVSTDAPEFLSVYTYDGEKTYLPDQMVSSEHNDKLSPTLKSLYLNMVSKLKTA